MGPVELGKLRIHKIFELDSGVPMPVALPGVTSADLARLKRWHDDPLEFAATPEESQMIFGVHSWLIEVDGLNILIDTCDGNHKNRSIADVHQLDTRYLDGFSAIGIAPEQIDMVLCTHLHFDHVGWNTHKVDGKWVPTFPNARYLFARKEYDYWQELRSHDDHGLHDVRHLFDCIDPIVEAGLADLIETDHCVSPELWIEPSHGHTPGHVHFCIESADERGVITGDLMHHPIQCAMPHRPATFDMDPEAGRATRMAFVDKHRDSGTMVIGAHFADPTAGWIKSYPDGTRFCGVGLED